MKRALLLVLTLLPGCFLERAPIIGEQGLDGGGIDSGSADGGVDACIATSTSDPCNGRDDDCDGTIDEDCECTPGTTQACGECGDGSQTCTELARWGPCMGGTTPTTYHRDADEDGFGDPTTTMSLCAPMDGWVTDATDCDDECRRCNTGGTEECNGRDDDCDGTPDDGAGTTYYRDEDGDGYGGTPMTACTDPGAGWTTMPGDCDDSCARCRPDYPGELCGDTRDNDCDGAADTACECDLLTTAGGEYLFCGSTESWDDARARCMDFGGDLASFDAAGENAAVWPLIDPYNRFIWIGGSDIDDEGTWVWTSGAAIGTCNNSSHMCSPCTRCNWHAGQPNTASDDCLVLTHDWGGQWGDYSCGELCSFLCEL